MARLRRNVEPETPSVALPDNLARFVFEHWARPEDEAANADGHGILGEYTTTEVRWGQAIREWAKDHNMTWRQARALVIEPPDWNMFRRQQLGR
jgi:hypothetical protein